MPVVEEPVTHDFAYVVTLVPINEQRIAPFGHEKRIDEGVGIRWRVRKKPLRLRFRYAVPVPDAELVQCGFSA